MVSLEKTRLIISFVVVGAITLELRMGADLLHNIENEKTLWKSATSSNRDLTALMLSATAPGPALRPLDTIKKQKELIMAYYYTWYTQGDWSKHGYVATPELGLYGTNNTAIAEQHIEWASGAIDGFVVSWCGKEHFASKHLANGLLKAKNLNKIKFSILYESKGRLAKLNGVRRDRFDFAEPEIMNRFINDFKHLKETYFTHEQYLRLDDGRPVVSLYVTRIFDNFNRTHIDRLEKELDMKLFIIADESFIDLSQNPETANNGIDAATGKSVFHAYTAYNMFEDFLVKDGESAMSYMRREAWPIFERWARKTIFFPHIMPSYHDFRGHKPLTGGKEELLTPLHRMHCLNKHKKETNIPYIMFLTSFNEWWEGTTVEPAKEYGTVYLDTLREYKQNPVPCDPIIETSLPSVYAVRQV